MKRLWLLVVVSLVLLTALPLGSAKDCYDNTYSYGSATAYAKVCSEVVAPTVTHPKAYKFWCESGKLYQAKADSCNENGCSSPKNDPYMHYLSPGETKTPMFTCWKYKQASNGDWAWSGADMYWYNVVYKGPLECEGSQSKCEGTDYYKCSSGSWSKQGKVMGQCGVECSSASQCANPTDYNCNSNQCVLKGRVGYWRLQDNKCVSVSLLPSQVTLQDYINHNECSDKIEKGFFDLIWQWILDFFNKLLGSSETGSLAGSPGSSVSGGSAGGSG